MKSKPNLSKVYAPRKIQTSNTFHRIYRFNKKYAALLNEKPKIHEPKNSESTTQTRFSLSPKSKAIHLH